MIGIRHYRICSIVVLRSLSSTRLQVLQNATQIVDPQRIRNVGIIAHIDAGNKHLRLLRVFNPI